MSDVVHERLATEAALDKLGARDISADQAAQLPRNEHVTVRNPRGGRPDKRRWMVGTTDGGRVLTLVIERTTEPTTRLIITGWSSTDAERREVSMSGDPWTANDPQPGDFDDALATIDAEYVERHEGDPNATLRILCK